MSAAIVVAAFVVAAGIGTLVRAALRTWNDVMSVPLGTLAVNLVGSFLLGVSVAWDHPEVTVVGTAFLGSLTTFSTLAGELADLEREPALVYGAGTVIGGIALAWLGLQV